MWAGMVHRDFVFCNETATTEIYTLSRHDALPIYDLGPPVDDRGRAGEAAGHRDHQRVGPGARGALLVRRRDAGKDRKSTRLNSSHANISYAVFCLKKKTLYATSTTQRHQSPSSAD